MANAEDDFQFVHPPGEMDDIQLCPSQEIEEASQYIIPETQESNQPNISQSQEIQNDNMQQENRPLPIINSTLASEGYGKVIIVKFINQQGKAIINNPIKLPN